MSPSSHARHAPLPRLAHTGELLIEDEYYAIASGGGTNSLTVHGTATVAPCNLVYNYVTLTVATTFAENSTLNIPSGQLYLQGGSTINTQPNVTGNPNGDASIVFSGGTNSWFYPAPSDISCTGGRVHMHTDNPGAPMSVDTITINNNCYLYLYGPVTVRRLELYYGRMYLQDGDLNVTEYSEHRRGYLYMQNHVYHSYGTQLIYLTYYDYVYWWVGLCAPVTLVAFAPLLRG